MAERRSILANVLALASGQAVAFALGLLMHAILARAVGPADYGTLGFAVAVLSYFGIAGTLGIDSWGMRAIAGERTRARAIVRGTVILRLALSLAAFAVLVGVVALWNRPALVSWVVLIQGAGLFTGALTIDYAFQGLERLDAAARRQVIASVLALLGVVAALAAHGGIAWAAAAIQGAGLLAALAMMREFRRLLPPTPTVGTPNWRRILAEASPFAVTQIIVTIYLSIDVIMLEFLRPEVEVGLYVAAVRILGIGLISAGVLRAAFAPALTRLMTQPAQRAAAGEHYARTVFVLGAAIALGGFVTAPDVLAIVFGADFAAAAPVLRILMVNLLVASLVEVYQTQLFAWHLARQQMIIMAAGALINILLNALLIPQWGMAAAAGNTLASSVAVLALAGFTLSRQGFEAHAATALRATLPALVLGSLALAYLPEMPMPVLPRFLIVGAIATALYAAGAWALGALRPAETWRFLAQKGGD